MKTIDLNLALHELKPDRPVFVLSRDKKGKPNGMTAAWNFICSDDPHILGVSIWNKGNTHKLIQQSKEFVIAVPNKSLEKELLFFGTHTGSKVDKFSETKIKTSKAKYVKVPLITDATYNFECKLIKRVPVGDCILFLGKILAGYKNPGKRILLSWDKIKGKRVFKEFKG